jgi:ATP-dependent RNA helicase DeaD
MLRMGFIDDVEWVLTQLPDHRQMALFSATMPAPIRKIAQKHQHDPAEITIKAKTTTVAATRQRYWMVSGMHKLDALTRILESEPFDGVLIFVRTRTMTVELAEKLRARGYACAPLNGDIAQRQRERTVEELKRGDLNILVATDVAARGLDLDRISHVVNYDIPTDTESYIHRIGRTGRAGRSGDAILFVSPRERHLLQTIERATRQKIELMEMPTTDMINNQRIARFKQRITDTLAQENLGLYNQIVDQYRIEHDIPALEIAAALARMVQGDQPLLLKKMPEKQKKDRPDKKEKQPRARTDHLSSTTPEAGMERYKVEVGHRHGINAGNIVGAIANEAGIDAEFIGRITIFTDFSYVDLPAGLPDDILRMIKKARLSGKPMNITRMAPERTRRVIKKRTQAVRKLKKNGKRNKNR